MKNLKVKNFVFSILPPEKLFRNYILALYFNYSKMEQAACEPHDLHMWEINKQDCKVENAVRVFAMAEG